MTLVATIPINGRPVFVGDLMISRMGVELPHKALPSIQDPAVILPVEWQRHIAGIHRKVCILSPRLVVGWTGRLLVAAQAISILKEAIQATGTKICVNSLFEILAQCEVRLQEEFENLFKAPEDLTLVGWLIDENGSAISFEWSRGISRAFHDGEVLARGSGAEDFLKYVKGRIGTTETVDRSDLTSVAMDAVALVSLLVADEVATGEGIQQLYGGGFEIVILTDHGFKYLNDILYVPLVIDGIEEEFASIYRPTYFLKYYYEDSNLAIARKILTLDSSQNVESDDVTISVIGDFGVSRKNLEALEIQSKYQFRSTIVSLIIVAQTNSGGVAYAPFVAGGASPFFRFDDPALLIHKQVFPKVIPQLKRQLSEGNSCG